MNHALIVDESVVINAPPSKVWAALTTPALIKEYLFGTETVTDWKLGSEIIFQGSYGKDGELHYRDKGVILQVVPNTLLSYRYWSGFSGLEDKPENHAIITYTLEPQGDTTVFTWRQQGFPDPARHQHAASGMKDFLAQIRAVAER